MNDPALAAITVLLASSAVGVQLAVEELVFRARALAKSRARAAFLRTYGRNRETLAAYAEAHGWATVFPLGVAGEVRGVGVTIAQTGGLDPWTIVTVEGGAYDASPPSGLAARLGTTLPGARARVLAPGTLRVEWIADLTDPRALDLALDALLDVAGDCDAGAYR